MHRDFVSLIHTKTTRDYLARVNEIEKATAAEAAILWGHDYWDGSRLTGYGGYRYDGRWKTVALAMIAQYDLKPGMKVLDVGCGKGFLLHDINKSCDGIEVYGCDISKYALDHSMESIKGNCQHASATFLDWPDNYFDLVISINTLHNLYLQDLWVAFREIERVKKSHSYICVEAYRNEREKVNLMYWQLTCRVFNTPEEWEFVFQQTGYSGDHEFIFFE